MPAIETLRSTHAFLGRKRRRPESGTVTMKSPRTKDRITASISSITTESSFVTATTLNNASSTMTASQPPTRKAHRPRPFHKPDVDSLFDLAHQHAGQSLFNNPILWTDLHLEVLSAKFITLPRCDKPHPEPSPTLIKPRAFSSRMLRFSKRISDLLAPHSHLDTGDTGGVTSRGRALHGMLQSMFPRADLECQEQLFKQLQIWLWGEPYQAICRLDGLYGHPDRPTLAYINKDGLEYRRRHKLFYAHPGPAGKNDPVHGLMDLRLKQILPVNRDHDPYLVSIFIAMAQKHFYGALTKGAPTQRNRRKYRQSKMPAFRDVKLHIITNDNASEFSVYTATVTAAFLERFHKPTRTPKASADDLGITMQHTKVAAWPMLGLKERLGRTLGRDLVCQDFDDENMDTWESDSESDSDSVATERISIRTNSDVSRLGRAIDEVADDGDQLAREASPAKKARLS